MPTKVERELEKDKKIQELLNLVKEIHSHLGLDKGEEDEG
jgi:hypothetical protein